MEEWVCVHLSSRSRLLRLQQSGVLEDKRMRVRYQSVSDRNHLCARAPWKMYTPAYPPAAWLPQPTQASDTSLLNCTAAR